MEGDPIYDGVIFAVRPATYDLAAKMLSDTPAGSVLHASENFLCIFHFEHAKLQSPRLNDNHCESLALLL